MTLSARIVDFMSPNPVTLIQGSTINRARRIFLEQGFTILPIVDDEGKVVGVLSPSDLIAEGESEDELEELIDRDVAELMTEAVVTAASTASVTDAAVSMTAHGIHHVVVVDLAGRPVGVLSTLDVAKAMADADLEEDVRTLMTHEVKWLDVGLSVGEALDRLEDTAASAMVVVDGHDYVGILSRLSLLGADRERRVDEVMERQIVNIPQDASVSELAATFAEERVRRMLVLNKAGRVVGIVTPTDLIHYAAGLAEFEGPDRDAMDDLAVEFEIVPYEADDYDGDEDEF